MADENRAVDDEAKANQYERKNPVQLDGYTVLLPEDAYHYYCDSSVVIFYEDEAREKELLRCEILARLDSPNPDKLVYRNDKYLAVFDSIIDYRPLERYWHEPFFTRGHSLYTRP